MMRPTSRRIARGALCGAMVLTLASAALAGRDIGVRLRGDLLVLDGARNKHLSVTIVPLRDGVRLVPGTETTLNRRDREITLRRVPRNWVFRFGQSAGVEVRFQAPGAGVPPLRPRTVAFIGARTTNRFFVDGLAIRRDLNLDLRRARDTFQTAIHLERSTIDGRLQVRQSRASADIVCDELTVGRFTKLAHKRQRRTDGRQANYLFTRCDLASLDVKVPVASAFVSLADSTVAGDVSLRGTVEARVTGTRIGGDLEMRTGSDPQSVELTDTTVDGEAFLTMGGGDDVVTIDASSFGALQLLGGPENDTLTTTGTTVGTGSLYDGGDGDTDRWYTLDGALLATTGVEQIAPPPE